MPFSYADSSLPRQPDSASPGRAYNNTEVLLCKADEVLYPGRIGIQTDISGVTPIVSLAVTANLPDAQTVVATFSGVTTADEVMAVGEYRGVPFAIGPVIYATGQPETLAAAVVDANQAVDQAGFTAGRSIVFTSDATTITATADVVGETFKLRWTVKGTGTISSQVVANPGIFAQGSAKPVLGVIVDGESAYAVDGGTTTQIDDLSPCSCAISGPVDAEITAAGAITTGQVLYVEPATGAKLTGTESATTVWIPPSFLRASGQAASSTANPETAAVRVFMRS